MEPVRVAAVRYLNTLPLIEGLGEVEGLEVISAVPSAILGLVAGGMADIGLVSLIDAARSPVPLALVPSGMIGCDGPTLTVRLYSAVPPERITTIHADTDSHTSVALARVVLAEAHGVRPEVVDFDLRERAGRLAAASVEEAWPETVLMIGDKVVTDSPPAVRYPHQVDLGEAWKALTGLPFVYAVWMCRASEASSERVRTAAALLDRQRRRNAMRPDWIVRTRAPALGWPEDLARRYLGTLLRYEVDGRAREGIDAFFGACERLGIATRPELVWSDHAATA